MGGSDCEFLHAKMKTLSSATVAILATRNFCMAQLFTFTLYDGTILRYTDADINLTYGGNTYSCGGMTGPYMGSRLGGGNMVRAHWKVGTDVDTITFDILPGSSTINGVDFLVACKIGIFDKADIVIDRVYMPADAYGDTSAGTVNIFTGIVGDVDASRSIAPFTCNSLTVLLKQKLPRNLMQPGCLNTLYDSACTLSRGSFSSSTTAYTGCTTSTVLSTGITSSAGYILGAIKFTSGQNNGFSRGIKNYTYASSLQTVNLQSPFPFAPAATDTFTIYRGCTKVLSDTTGGCASFNNEANFRGFPYVPQPVTAV